jgi:hypothetical protein
VTELRVFAASDGRRYVEVSHPGVAYAVRLSVPMLSASDARTKQVNSAFLVPVRFLEETHYVAFASVNIHALWRDGVALLGRLDENASRDVLNHLVDILAYD